MVHQGTEKISALLLAAGQGSRMQYQAKALLRCGHRTFVQHALHELYRAGMGEIILVTGFQSKAVTGSAADTAVPWREAHNPRFAEGLLGSIQCGISACAPEIEAVLITLVDLPFLRAADYRAVCEAWRDGDPHNFLRSRSEGQPAHPVIIPRLYFVEILTQGPSEKGCSFLFQKYPERVRSLEIAHGRIDIDRIEDYHAHFSS